MKPLLRLFKAVEIKSKEQDNTNKDILKETIKHGFIFSPEVVFNYSDHELFKLIIQIQGLTSKQMNSSFHTSWEKIRTASIEQLVLEQIIHYITTYGFESLGIYDESSVYIPNEKLEIPEFDGLRLTVIRGYTKKEIKEKVLELLKSGIALGKDTIDDVVELSKYVKIEQENIEDIKNKEVMTALCNHLGIFPENPTEFLRYVIYTSISRTLLIKDAATIEMLKVSNNKIEVEHLFNKYKEEYGLKRLAEIFHHFKPIFLAFRSDKSMRPMINKIRRLAVYYHKPIKPDYLNEVTSWIKKGWKLNESTLNAHLETYNMFRKIRLAYALKYRTKDVDSIVYKIRNGKGFADEFSFDNKNEAKRVLRIVLDSIIVDLRKNVEGKRIFIPSNFYYAIPATEKQFSGDFPLGSYVKIPKDMVFGIHWNNVDHHRIDLDLSLISPETGKIGWDGAYRNSDILFSGDMTDAKDGASELFYVKRQKKIEAIMLVNYYNYNEDIEVPFSIIVAQTKIGELKRNYMVDPNNVVATANTKINERQKVLGLLVTTTKECRFYFVETNIGQSITSGNIDYVEKSRKYLSNFYQNTISLNEILSRAGAILVSKDEEYDIDLSPENIEKDSIIKLLSNWTTVLK